MAFSTNVKITRDKKGLSREIVFIVTRSFGLRAGFYTPQNTQRSQINCSLRSRSSLTQRSNHIQLGSLSLATDTARFARTESHTKAGFICPALALLASGAPWWQIWMAPSGKTLLASLAQNHIPRQASSAQRSRCSLVVPPGGRSGCHLVARHCSLCSCRITYQDRLHLPIARVAC